MKQEKPHEDGLNMVWFQLSKVERSIEILRMTIERRIYDEVVDNAVRLLSLQYMTLKSQMTTLKDKLSKETKETNGI